MNTRCSAAGLAVVVPAPTLGAIDGQRPDLDWAPAAAVSGSRSVSVWRTKAGRPGQGARSLVL